MMLRADDKLIEPLSNAQYLAGWPDGQPVTNTTEPWPVSRYFNPPCWAGTKCAFAVFVFPVIEGAKTLTIIVIGGDGTRIEKNAAPKLFEAP
jgi:hypothetical protein